MKVLQIHDKELQWDPEQNTGGISVYLSDLVTGLRGRGWKVSMIRFTPKPAPEIRNANGLFELKSSSYRPSLSTLSALLRIIRDEEPDIIHLHSVYYAMNPVMLHRLRRLKPVIYTLHDVTPLCFWHTKLHPEGDICTVPIGFTCMTRGCYRLGAIVGILHDFVRILMNPVQLWEYRRLPMIIVPSQYLRDQLLGNGFSPDQVRVLPHFSRFCGSPLPEDTDEKRILFVGRLVREKGIDEFVEALALLRAERWEAVIVGSGPLLESTRQRVSQRGLSHRVRFVGNVYASALKRHYQSCDFVVFSSLIPESFGLVGIEAMSFGKPVVAFASGGITEWLQDGINGLLVGHGDVPQLARQMDRLIENPELRKQLGMNGFRWVASRSSLDRHLDELVGWYDHLIGTFAKG